MDDWNGSTTPPRTGINRVIPPLVYRHLRFCGSAALAGGGVAAAVGFICLAYVGYAWAAFFLVLAALAFAGGFWYLATARSSSLRA
jgi:hypothetical protein